MIDYFAVLNEPRRPWIDQEQLKQKYLDLTSSAHPDRWHAAPDQEKTAAHDRYLLLNSAYNVLRSDKARLAHLLELESGQRPKEVQNISPELMELFVSVGQLCQKIDAFLPEKRKACPPLVQAELFAKGQELSAQVQGAQEHLRQLQATLQAELASLNQRWSAGSGTTANPLPLKRLEEIYRAFSYLNKWTQQLQDRFVHLVI